MKAKDKRREVRLAASDDDILAEAAGIAGVSVSTFLLDRALADAEAIVESHRQIHLEDGPYQRFLALLDAPLNPPDALVKQARLAQRLKRVE